MRPPRSTPRCRSTTPSRSLDHFFFSGVFIKFANLKSRTARVNRLGAVPARAGRRCVDAAPGVGARQRTRFLPAVDYYYDHVYCCFFRDRHGLISLESSS